MGYRLSLLLAFALMAAAGPVQACMADNSIEAAPGIYIPSSPTGSIGLQFATLPAQMRGYLRMGFRKPGDRWDIAETGENDLVAWRAEPEANGLKLWLWGKTEGTTDLPLRYLPSKGAARPGRILVHIAPPLPPPEPLTLTVEGPEFTGTVSYGRSFRISLKTPLAPDHRWEVKEAVFSNATAPGRENWEPFTVEAMPAESGLFRAITWGQTARIVFIQKRDGWQLFPHTATLLLTVMPTPTC